MRTTIGVALTLLLMIGSLAVVDTPALAEFPTECADADRVNPNNRFSPCKWVGEPVVERIEYVVVENFPQCEERLVFVGIDKNSFPPDSVSYSGLRFEAFEETLASPPESYENNKRYYRTSLIARLHNNSEGRYRVAPPTESELAYSRGYRWKIAENGKFLSAFISNSWEEMDNIWSGFRPDTPENRRN